MAILKDIDLSVIQDSAKTTCMHCDQSQDKPAFHLVAADHLNYIHNLGWRRVDTDTAIYDVTCPDCISLLLEASNER